MEKEDLEFQELYDRVATTATKLTLEHSALAVAAVMNAIAMSIYKTALPDQDYEKMAKLIYDLRDDVQIFTSEYGDESEILH